MYYKMYQSPIGNLIIVTSETHLIGLWKEEQIKNGFIFNDNLEIINKTVNWLDRYFNLENPLLKDLELELVGTPFQIEVWKILLDIPYGEVITYGDISKIIAKRRGLKRMSAQAVGGAVGSNPISIIVPCHRVMGSNNNLTGYGGGIDMKVWLLKHEGLNTDEFKMPKVKNV